MVTKMAQTYIQNLFDGSPKGLRRKFLNWLDYYNKFIETPSENLGNKVFKWFHWN